MLKYLSCFAYIRGYYMSDEKRLYRRIKVGAKSLVYDGNNEYEGTLKDISENGVGIVVNKEDGEILERSDTLELVVLDDDDIRHINTRVVRSEKRDDSMVIGGRIKNQKDVVDYVRGKETEEYLDNLK